MSRFSGGSADDGTPHYRAAVREQKRREAEDRNAVTPDERRRAARRLSALAARVTVRDAT